DSMTERERMRRVSGGQTRKGRRRGDLSALVTGIESAKVLGLLSAVEMEQPVIRPEDERMPRLPRGELANLSGREFVVVEARVEKVALDVHGREGESVPLAPRDGDALEGRLRVPIVFAITTACQNQRKTEADYQVS